MEINYWELSAAIVSIYAVYLISVPNIKGYYVGMIGQLCWSIFAIQKDYYFLLGQCIILSIINIIGWYNWNKKGVGK